MGINVDSLTGKEKQPLTRADVEKRLQQAGSSKRLNLAGETITHSDLSNLDLSGADLSNTRLSHANLSDADLSRSDLSSTDLSGADLRYANLSDANLSDANLSDANLHGADLRNTNLTKAILSSTDLGYTNLRKSKLNQTNLSKADLSGADLSGVNLSEADLSGANLSGANLSEAYLREANLNELDLTSTNLAQANLNGAYLREAYLVKANLSRANLSGTIMSRAFMSEANLHRADLIQSYLGQADLSGADLSGADLSGADLSGADLSGANLSGAKLKSANFSRANLSKADLSEAKLIGANLIGANLINANLNGADLIGAIIRLDLDNPNLTRAIREQISRDKNQKQDRESIPILRIRIEKEPLTASHLSDVLDTFTSLYVKIWLLQQHRFDDFLLYTEKKERRFEEEAHLLVAEIKYNSPVDIKFNFDLSPKSLIEALQMLVEMVNLRKHREQSAVADNRSKDLDNQLKEETVKQAQLKTIEQCIETARRMVETIDPTLDNEQKALAINSLLKDLLKLTQDPAIEVSLPVFLTYPHSHPVINSSVEVTHPSTQPSVQSFTLHPKEAI